MSKSSEVVKNIVAGIFMILGVALIFVFIFTIGKDKGLTESKFQVTVLFRNIGGLDVGAPVRLSGVVVGNVGNIDFLEKEVQGRKVRVDCNIFSRYRKQLNKSSRFLIRTEGLLGEKLIEIFAAEHPEPLDVSKPVIGEDAFDAQDLAVVFANAAESFTNTATQLSEIDILEFTDVMTKSSHALMTTSESFHLLMNEIEDISIKSKRIFNRLEEKLLEDDLFTVF